MRIQLITAALALLASGCNSTYYSHKFLPAPIEAPSAVEGDASSQARVLVTVIGIRRADSSAGEPVQVEARLQVENLGSTPALLEVQGLSLRDSALTEFDPARVSPEPAPIAQGESALYDVRFPLPEGLKFGDLKLQGLSLSWSLGFGSRSVTTGVTFERYQNTHPSTSASVHFHYGRYGRPISHPRPTPY